MTKTNQTKKNKRLVARYKINSDGKFGKSAKINQTEQKIEFITDIRGYIPIDQMEKEISRRVKKAISQAKAEQRREDISMAEKTQKANLEQCIEETLYVVRQNIIVN